MSISALVIDRVTRKCPRQRIVTELPVKTLKEIEYWSERGGREVHLPDRIYRRGIARVEDA